MKFALPTAAAVLFAALASPVVAGGGVEPEFSGGLIRNGSFERPLVPVGSGTFYGIGANIKGWKVIGPSGNVGVNSGELLYCDHKFPAKKAKQWLDLTGNVDDGAPRGVQQTIQTTPGNGYVAIFYVGNVIDTGGICGTTSNVKVLVDGVEIGSFTNSGGRGDTQSWKQFQVIFTAAHNRTDIAFINGDPAGDFDNGLDAVSVQPAG